MKEYNDKEYNKLPDFSKANYIEDVFDILYNFITQKWKIAELDLFLIDGINKNKLENISASVNLKNVYNELEERGILEFAANTNEIKIIPNIDESLEQIKSIIIIPINLLQENTAYFIANSPVNHNEIDISSANIIHLIAEHSYTLISILKSIKDNNIENKKYNLLKQQTINASNQIAISELLVALNDGFDIPRKIIKTNLELIQKGIGDTKRRMDIINEQFNSIMDIQSKIQKLSADLSNTPKKCNIIDLIEQAISIVKPILNKFGIILTTNLKDNESLFINCFSVQMILAIHTFITKSISNMQDGGIINISLFKNDNSTISNDSGFITEDIKGNIIPDLDVSPKKMKLNFLYTLSQNIITNHNGKTLIHSDDKGTVYKIILNKTI